MTKYLNGIRKIFEEVIPSIAFSILFITFIIQIFSRYVLNNPITWAYEITIFSFIWMVFLGGLLSRGKRNDIAFTALYENLSNKIQLWSDLINNIIVMLAYPIVIYYSIDYILFISYSNSPVLKMPLSYVFSVVVIYFAGVLFYSILDIIELIKKIKSRSKGGHNQ